MATGLVNEKGHILIPYRIITPQTIAPKTFVTAYYVGNGYICTKFDANPSTEGFYANG